MNAAPAYVVNDIYRRYINPNAGRRTLIWMSYAVSFALVVIGILFGLHARDITGTMRLVYLCFVYGMKSVWIPWLW